jgi:ubiquinone/menaquinone biosynthesis C-methylase UbiE
MHKHPPTDYLPAAGRDSFLPFYDILTKALGVGRLHRKLVDQAGLKAGQKVLEIGCGTGNLSKSAKRAQPGIDLSATDPDEKALARATKKAPDINFEKVYAQELPYADDTFDVMLSALMLHHLDRDTKIEALREATRVLKPGGSLHIVDIAGHRSHTHGARPHFDDLPELLETAGFQIVKRDESKHLGIGRVVYLEARQA